MKPKVGAEASRSEMAQEELDPLDLMSGVAILVLEARTPDPSVKGRVEGPHCPIPRPGGHHMCSKETLECLRAMEFRKRIDMMWRNGIPSCIDILLFPSCPHGLDEARSLDGVASNYNENSLLLERWSIHCIQKWHGEWSDGVVGSMLLQAVRSYLYFSQLSSWLSSMHGYLPVTIAYRLYAPGEEAGMDFIQPPDSHIFPTGIYGPHGLKVQVQSLPRQEEIPALLCVLSEEKSDIQATTSDNRKWGNKSLRSKSSQNGCRDPEKRERATKKKGWRKMAAKERKLKNNSEGLDQKFSNEELPPSEVHSRADLCQPISIKEQSVRTKQRHPSAFAQEGISHNTRCQKLIYPPLSVESVENLENEFGAMKLSLKSKPKEESHDVKGHRSSVRDSLESQLKPLELPHPVPAQHLDLHSPKVLMSADKESAKLLVKKKCIDFRSVDDTDIDVLPSFNKVNEVFLSRCFQDLENVLSPVEIQSFLANLQSFGRPGPLSYDFAFSKSMGFPTSTDLTCSERVLKTSTRVDSDRSKFRKCLPAPVVSPEPAQKSGIATSESLSKSSSFQMKYLLSDNAFNPENSKTPMLGLEKHSSLTSSIEPIQTVENVSDKTASTPIPINYNECRQLHDQRRTKSAKQAQGKVESNLLVMPETLEQQAFLVATEEEKQRWMKHTSVLPVSEEFSCKTKISWRNGKKEVIAANMEQIKYKCHDTFSSDINRDATSDACNSTVESDLAWTNSHDDNLSSSSLPQSSNASLPKIESDVDASSTSLFDSSFSHYSLSSHLCDTSPQFMVDGEVDSSGSSTPTSQLSPPQLPPSLDSSFHGRKQFYSYVGANNCLPEVDHQKGEICVEDVKTVQDIAVPHLAQTSPSSKSSIQEQILLSASYEENQCVVKIDDNFETKKAIPAVKVELNCSTPHMAFTHITDRKDVSYPSFLFSNETPEAKNQICADKGVKRRLNMEDVLLTSELQQRDDRLSEHQTLSCYTDGKSKLIKHSIGLRDKHFHLHHTAECVNASSASNIDIRDKQSQLHHTAECVNVSSASNIDIRDKQSQLHHTAECVDASFANKTPNVICFHPQEREQRIPHSSVELSSFRMPEVPIESPEHDCKEICLDSADQTVLYTHCCDKELPSSCKFCLNSSSLTSFSSTSDCSHSHCTKTLSPSSIIRNAISHKHLQELSLGLDFSSEKSLHTNKHHQSCQTKVDIPCREKSDDLNITFKEYFRSHSKTVSDLANVSLSTADSIENLSNKAGDDSPSLGLQRCTSHKTSSSSFQRPVFSLPDCDDVFSNDQNVFEFPKVESQKDDLFLSGLDGVHKQENIYSSDAVDSIMNNSEIKQRNHDMQMNSLEEKKQFPLRAKSTPNFIHIQGLQDKENVILDEVPRGRLALKDKTGTRGLKGHELLRKQMVKSASMVFHSRSGLPSQSSPAPIKRRSTGRFDYDETLTTARAIKNALSMSRLMDASQDGVSDFSKSGRILSTSAPASTNCLLGNFEESILNGRLEPAGIVDGFMIDIGASGSFCPQHLSLPVTAYFFNLSDDNAPSPYLGHVDLDGVGKKGYHIPRKGTLQVTLFNPNKTVVKMFVVMYDLADMPNNSQTVIRQRTVYMPVNPNSDEPSYLRYLIHLRVASSGSGKIYLHTDVRLIFARNKFELDTSVAQYELRSFTEMPINPKYSPKR